MKEEVGHLEKTIDTGFDAANVKFGTVNTRINSLERRISMTQGIADLKARPAAVERRTPGWVRATRTLLVFTPKLAFEQRETNEACRQEMESIFGVLSS